MSEAAEHLHLTQSTVIYTLKKLQEQFSVRLLQIEGRKANLTAAGREMLESSRDVLNGTLELADRASISRTAGN